MKILCSMALWLAFAAGVGSLAGTAIKEPLHNIQCAAVEEIAVALNGDRPEEC